MSIRILAVCAAFVSTVALAQPASSIDERVEALLSKMTLEEKLGQMSQASYNNRPATIAAIRTAIRQEQLGSVLNVIGPAQMNDLQRIAVEETRLKIPLINGLDVIHGFRTQFPVPLAQACSWNPGLVEQAARAAAMEASSMGVHWTFAPMLDVNHDPRWGRVMETCGEDPYLTSQLGAAMVRGFQGPDFASGHSLAACAKHYVGYGASEAGRDYNTTLIPEPELRNIHLPPFKAAREAGVLTFMSAFNDLNGVPASANPFTLRTVLRDEWGFRGFVVSDWESVKELIAHGLAANEADAAALAINAGVDMEMVSESYLREGPALLKAGRIKQETIDEAVRNILRVKFQIGLFDHPYTEDLHAGILLSEPHLRLAQELATQSMVLLKNEEQLLPLPNNPKSVAVIGPLADSQHDMYGAWHGDGRPEDNRTVWSVIKGYVAADVQLHFAAGLPRSASQDETGIPEAVEAAKKSDYVILCVGEGEELSGEARSRAFIRLPGAQEKLIQAIAETGKPIALVVFAGRPLVFDAAAAKVQSILYAWHPGTMAGPAVCDLLFGRVAPSGKLTISFPRTEGQIPVYYNHRSTGRPAQNEVLGAPMGTPQDPQGYFSKFIDVHSSPAYPFGYGLTYTTFGYKDLAISQPDQNGARSVSTTVTNLGKRDGVEIVQLYIQDPAASLTRPVRELKGFQRLSLRAGESRTVTFNLTRENLGFYGRDGKFVVEPGVIRVFVGGSSEANLGSHFTLE